MNHRRWSLFLLLAMLGTLGWWLLARHQSRPSVLRWNGQSAEYWIGRLSYHDLEGAEVSAEEFLFSAGPEVVPVLTSGLQKHDHWIYDQWHALYFKLGQWQRYFSLPVNRAGYRANCARGLGLIGPPASAAVPNLKVALRDPNPEVRRASLGALGRITRGTSGVTELLVAGLADPDPHHRLACLWALKHCLPGHPKAAEALRGIMVDPDSNFRAIAAEALGRDITSAHLNFPLLTNALHDSSLAVRMRAARSLARLPGDRTGSADALRFALETKLSSRSNDLDILILIGALSDLGPDARSAKPLLLRLSQTNDASGDYALIGLGRLEPADPRWTEELVLRLELSSTGDPFGVAWELGRRGEFARDALPALGRLATMTNNARLQTMAATSAWRIDPASPEPFSLLSNYLSPTSVFGRYEIVRLLGELGPAGRPAAPALRRLLYSRGIMMHDYAREALESVAPDILENPWN
ncbi:MAG: HEAT repeat domain-containing protein [Verrucomicrobiae bacterium]|nr:HEAT repeat domain-containing protein [Verrucomicrobiae bacterium]